MQRLEPDGKSLVNIFACKVPQTISITPEEQAEEAILAAITHACECLFSIDHLPVCLIVCLLIDCLPVLYSVFFIDH